MPNDADETNFDTIPTAIIDFVSESAPYEASVRACHFS